MDRDQQTERRLWVADNLTEANLSFPDFVASRAGDEVAAIFRHPGDPNPQAAHQAGRRIVRCIETLHRELHKRFFSPDSTRPTLTVDTRETEHGKLLSLQELFPSARSYTLRALSISQEMYGEGSCNRLSLSVVHGVTPISSDALMDDDRAHGSVKSHTIDGSELRLGQRYLFAEECIFSLDSEGKRHATIRVSMDQYDHATFDCMAAVADAPSLSVAFPRLHVDDQTFKAVASSRQAEVIERRVFEHWDWGGSIFARLVTE
jgi:hypothetical protein